MQTISRQNGFEVWFQPIQCCADGKFCSMEALIRLREKDGKLISPAEFIPLAEQTGQISAITWFVLEETCRVLKNTPELEGVTVSINLPMPQLLENGFVPRFVSAVNQAGIDHHLIRIEFTERAMMENFEQSLSVMQQLFQEGFQFYLDDFGANYSNFNCLLQLPFQVIKLDSCLVHTKKNGMPDYSTVHTLTKLFHDMDMVVVAEGAETEEEVRMLKEQGVDRIQGFALARPMPEDTLVEFYREHKLL
jgi:EAL domain-containing protein (putative c-di-GMP-specific phosphodiesterase class I)